jgi:SAM-dependent methyltransferase
LFDDFYAEVYDQLAQGGARLQAETGLALHAFRQGGIPIESMRILDAGCGTAIVTAALAKMNVEKVISVDGSAAMIKRAKTHTLPQTTLTEKQLSKIEFRNSNLMNPSALAPGEVSNAIVFYFVLYYMHDLEAFFRNMYVWVRPGGMIAVEVVNKYKFDPMLDSSAPWMGFSLQKYSKDRITHSKVTFDKFEYEGKFDLIDPVAEFRETFRFKDGSVRKQKHVFVMPSIEEIVKVAKTVGWEYTSYVDLTSIGFEYAYLLIFKHP